MAGNFNIRNNSWNLSLPYHSSYCDLLTNIVDFMNLYVSKSTNQVSTRFLNNPNNSNSVINLLFIHLNSLKFDNHIIHPEWKLSSDHASLTVDIAINEEQIYTKKYTIVKNSKEENKFIAELIESIKGLVKIIRSGLSFFLILFFSFYFYFIFYLFSYLLFIELRVRINDWSQIMRYRGKG